MTIPDGYEKVEHGCVAFGDMVWATATSRWVEVDDAVMNDLHFLDAIAVEELVCVARKRKSPGIAAEASSVPTSLG